MRVLDGRKLSYEAHAYPCTEALSGTEVAAILNQDPTHVFKTLVTVAASKKNYVFVIPVGEELSLKKAAQAVHEKSIEMLRSKDLLPLTGYVHGGCSPIGMKKAFPTVIDETVLLCETIMFSAGKIGYQVEMTPETLKQVVDYEIADVTM
ncbi:MAG: Cys-tRNA(Pro) deacylase [Clostridia bacterium]|nr:Cys-tRNA(Pro) deacylase [Clostridia bacterium]